MFPKKTHKNIQTKKLFELNTEQIQWAKKNNKIYITAPTINLDNIHKYINKTPKS